MRDINHVFFDLDDTLLDFRANVKQTLYELYDQYELGSLGISSHAEFFKKYDHLNRQMWTEYRNGQLSQSALRNKRFVRVFKEFKILDEELAQEMSIIYLEQVSEKSNLNDGVYEVLDTLVEKYQLHIITNGFRDVQQKKLINASLKGYFKQVITSEDSGFLKPNPEMFYYALTLANAVPEESVYIGDSLEVDIKGAGNAGISLF